MNTSKPAVVNTSQAFEVFEVKGEDGCWVPLVSEIAVSEGSVATIDVNGTLGVYWGPLHSSREWFYDKDNWRYKKEEKSQP